MELPDPFLDMNQTWDGPSRRRVIRWLSPGLSYLPEQRGIVVIPVTDLPDKGANRA